MYVVRCLLSRVLKHRKLNIRAFLRKKQKVWLFADFVVTLQTISRKKLEPLRLFLRRDANTHYIFIFAREKKTDERRQTDIVAALHGDFP